jgi:hypothetical protein
VACIFQTFHSLSRKNGTPGEYDKGWKLAFVGKLLRFAKVKAPPLQGNCLEMLRSKMLRNHPAARGRCGGQSMTGGAGSGSH